MLMIVRSVKDLDFAALMQIYAQTIVENGADAYPYFNPHEQRHQAEQDFYYYLQTSFFQDPAAFYALWRQDGCSVAALRMEPYRDGLLLEALETEPEARNKGYATQLLNAVLKNMDMGKQCPVYAHVSKQNLASLRVHEKCGFAIVSDFAAYIDGSVSRSAFTLRYSKK